MSEEEYVDLPTSPTLDANDGVIHSAKEFSGALTLDLNDDEIAVAMRELMSLKHKWEDKFRRKFNDPHNFSLDEALKKLAEFEDEVKTTLAERLGVLCTVDTTPILLGEPLAVEWIGKLPGSSLDTYGFDHEKKEWEVKRANARNEDYLGQKE
jgi:hypothetical protein